VAKPLWGGALVIMKAKSKLALAALILAAAGGGAALVAHRTGASDPAAPRPAAHRPAAPARLAAAPAGPPSAAGPDARPLALIAARTEVDPSAARGSIEGRVVDGSTAAPVAGAEVVLSLPDGASTSVASDAAGAFRFEPDRPGRVAIAAITAPGYLPFAPEWGQSPIELVARPGMRVRDVIVYLAPAVDYTGVVLAPDGAPVPRAQVRIIGLPAAELAALTIPDRFSCDERGEFRFHAPDEALFEARARGYGPGRASLDRGAQTTRRLILRLSPAGGAADALGTAGVSGAVVDAAGAPLPGVLVEAAPVAPEPRPGPGHGDELAAVGRAVTGSDGGFAIDGLDPGDYRVEARDQARAPARAAVALAAGERARVRLTMTSGATLAGSVGDASGRPVPAFTVIVFESEGLARGRVVATRTMVDSGGTFAVDGLEAGEYRVQASAHGHAPSRPADAEAVLPPARPDPVALRLPAGGTLTGVVRARGGGPIAEARVTVEGGLGEGPTPVPFSASAVTDRRGEFALRGLAPGRRSVVVLATGHHGAIASGLEVAEGARLGPIEIALDPLAAGERPTVELAGIGAALSATDDSLRINEIVPGGGAQAAGLVAGDEIVSIDGRGVLDLGFEDAIQAIRGPVGSSVRLGVRRAASPGAVADVLAARLKIRY
jgi:hypothetical protein